MTGLYLTAGPMTREWCSRCLTTAIVRCDLFELTPDGVRLTGYYRACQRCTNPELRKP